MLATGMLTPTPGTSSMRRRAVRASYDAHVVSSPEARRALPATVAASGRSSAALTPFRPDVTIDHLRTTGPSANWKSRPTALAALSSVSSCTAV